jgi:hypothetical protein
LTQKKANPNSEEASGQTSPLALEIVPNGQRRERHHKAWFSGTAGRRVRSLFFVAKLYDPDDDLPLRANVARVLLDPL